MWGRSMKLLATRFRREDRADPRRAGALVADRQRVRWQPWALGLFVPALLFVASGCVTAGSHREVVAERDQLARDKSQLEHKLDDLEKSNASLDAESVRLLEQLEDLRGERQQLSVEVADLRQTREHLSDSLASREMELVAQNEEVFRLRSTYDGLVEDLEAEVSAGRIEIRQLRDGLQVNVRDDILFSSGSATLNDEGRDVLAKVAEQLSALDHLIEVRGHTDNIQIRGSLVRRYPSNWELAGARAASVVRLFQDRGIGGARLTAVSKGEFEPVAPNDTDEDRWQNRRIEIRLLPMPELSEFGAADVAEGAKGVEAAVAADRSDDVENSASAEQAPVHPPGVASPSQDPTEAQAP